MTQTKQLPTLVLEGPKTGFQNYPEWETVKDVGSVVGSPILQLDEFLHKGEDHVNGDTMVKRAEKMGNLAGQYHAECLLEQQDNIPTEWRDYYLVFPGTIRRSPYGGLLVPCLYWNGNRWNLNFNWLDNDFGSSVRLVRLRK